MKILLAIDDSPASRLAVEEVAVHPWPPNTEVELFHVVESGPAWGHAEGLQTAYDNAASLMQSSSEIIHAVGKKVFSSVAMGDTKAAIIDRAAETGVDLIVVGSHRISAIAHFLLGNTAKYVMRHAPCSVMIVRGDRAGKEGPRRILLATDGSEPSVEAARGIAARPWPTGSTVHILSVVEVVLPTMHALFEPPFVHSSEVERLRGEALLRAQNATASAAAILAPTGLPVTETVSVLLEGTRSVILKEVRDWGADILFVGSHGHGVTERLLMGSVSEWLATHAPCSVEIVRPRVKAPETGS